MSKPRTFDVDRSLSRAEALRVIVAALDDEGLALTVSDTAGVITTVLVDGIKRVIIPAHRIVDRNSPAAPHLEVIK